MRKKLLAILAGIGAALGLGGPAVAVAWGNYTTPVTWGDAGTVYLLDGGVKQSVPVMLQNPLAGITCTGNGVQVLQLGGSNDGLNFAQSATPIAMDGGKNTWTWDPVTSGLEWLAIAVDGGSVPTSGSISCLITQKGTAP